MGAKKQGKKSNHPYSFDKWYDYYQNKLGKFKLPNHVIKYEKENNSDEHNGVCNSE